MLRTVVLLIAAATLVAGCDSGPSYEQACEQVDVESAKLKACEADLREVVELIGMAKASEDEADRNEVPYLEELKMELVDEKVHRSEWLAEAEQLRDSLAPAGD